MSSEPRRVRQASGGDRAGSGRVSQIWLHTFRVSHMTAVSCATIMQCFALHGMVGGRLGAIHTLARTACREHGYTSHEFMTLLHFQRRMQNQAGRL